MKLSSPSLAKLSECHLNIQKLIQEVSNHYDIVVLEGHRSKERQQQLLEQGKTKVLKGKHNELPSLAIDIAPIPVNWSITDPKNMARYYYLAGVVKGIATQLNIKIRWGGDWDGDNDFKDQTFDDLVHFELV